MNCVARRVSVIGFAVLTSLSFGQSLRIATWNISDFDGDLSAQNSAVQTAMFAEFQGRSMRADVLFAQEIQSSSAANIMVNLLNSATGSTGDWATNFTSLSGTNGTGDTAMFYRTSRVGTVSNTLVAAAAGTSGNPRDVRRWDFSILDNAATNEVISVYNSHMKSGTTTTDQNRRNVEATAIRNNANGLAANHQIVALGDFNFQSASQSAWGTLTGAGSNTRGQFFDPIDSVGSWNNNSDYRFVHTQDPSGAGMDDRLDFILMGGGLGDGVGTEYSGVWQQTYSTSTWSDMNHSYRVWGNDGTSFNAGLTVAGNTMVGSTIAQALVDAADGGGHLPVFADISYQAVPEPATMVVLAGLGMIVARRRRKS